MKRLSAGDAERDAAQSDRGGSLCRPVQEDIRFPGDSGIGGQMNGTDNERTDEVVSYWTKSVIEPSPTDGQEGEELTIAV